MPTRFIFPDAPVRAVTINGGYMMRAWYDIYEDISADADQDEEGIKSSAGMLSLLVEEEIRRGIVSERIILAGFSQGGAVALYAGLTSGEPLGGVMALSAYLPLAHQLTADTIRSEHVPSVFMAHGRRDAVVPFSYGEASYRQLKDLGIPVDWNTYDMEHNMNAEEIFAIREWLIERLG